MTRTLADKRIKLAALTEEPVNPERPTVAELNAGIGGPLGIACLVAKSDWTFGPTDSETVNDAAVCEDNVSIFGASNFQAGMSVYRWFNPDTGAVEVAQDTLWAAAKVKGSRLWLYERETGKEWDEAWDEDDELSFGAEVITDNPQPPSDRTGYIKRRVPMQVQKGYTDVAVGAGA